MERRPGIGAGARAGVGGLEDRLRLVISRRVGDSRRETPSTLAEEGDGKTRVWSIRVSEPPTAKSNEECEAGEMLRSSASSLLRPRRFSSLADGSFGGDASSSVSEKIAVAVLFERLPVVIPKTDPVVYAFQELS
ncbi:hypothetical protein C4D60_Mb09t17410 [Musa balbisiana]|uniref:Uncharacterized protein n=1 Tax=Musa balbisiana TaxID=52838 RepID=A0A4S8IHU9_MUSBA|nr:hypothetical protein C4D60_Mb09t17410 [Musa balbisiana]